jgi:hypothetical protein
MVEISKYISVFLIGIVELWVAVPTGLAFKLNPMFIAGFSAAGAATGACLVLIAGEPLRAWLLSLKKSASQTIDGKMNRIWRNYGVPGLCLLAPLLVGAHIGAAIGMALGGRRTAIAVWMTISCLLWAALFTFLGITGVSLFHK